LAIATLPGATAWLALLAGISLLGTVIARRYALRRDLLDHPGERRSHVVSTPRGGGIGIVFAMLVAMGALAWRDHGQAAAMALAATGLLLVAGIGWLDDHRPLSPWPRLAVHAIAACLLGAVAYRASGQAEAALFAFALAMVLVNIWNFMDGIDGIASLQALVVACACALLARDPSSRWLSLALAAACLGFLPMNLPRARIFLGDVGSGALGYILALAMVLAATGTGRPASLSTWMLVLLPASAFLVDAALTLVSRIVRGERWWTPHVGHAYQRWARVVGSHWPVTFAYAVWAAAAGVLACMSRDWSEPSIMYVGSAWYLGGGILWLWFQLHHDHRSGLPGKKSG
jgi:UDP-N-acetylmuramyl pentapeptide phosphotransferase/UDP-N-acetylglucosamine-1-phosphate transferase